MRKNSREWWVVSGEFFVVCILTLFFFTSLNATEVELQISKQVGRKMDLALASPQNVTNSSNALPKIFEETLSFDLGQSGYFQLIKNASNIERIARVESPDSLAQGPDWKALGADLVVKSACQWNGETGTLDLYAFDVSTQRRVFGKRYALNEPNLRTAAHNGANDLIYRLTGEKGIAGTKIAYVAGGPTYKEVFICDADGKNVRQLTQDHTIILGVSWQPNGNKILYTSYKEGQPRIYLHDLSTGQRQRFASYPGLNAAAKFSPDGSRVALVLSKDGNPEIYISDLQGRNLKRLTNHPGVDSSPVWSPDGQKIAFVSDRSGHPHIYMIYLANGLLTRLTRQGSYNSSPSWSPKGDKIAFSSDMNGSFKICVLDLNDETITIVSQEGGEAEEPDWAPDNRHIVYSSKLGGVYQLFIVDTGDGQTVRLTAEKNHYLTPAWSL
ncbi:MAG: Tol-Pal system beta propeller repeat protein TolB [Chlamydiae bacterium]|nr:Tol-Pal system beta propeller repeat protein TolB [Chlamydiota bacterium]MBI3265951.1 Tol-Pal system beta propeller repeat protein TolB [Chlamydiota bacterium]